MSEFQTVFHCKMAVFTLETLKSTTKRRTVTETNQAAALIGGPKLRKDRQLGQTSNLRRVEPIN